MIQKCLQGARTFIPACALLAGTFFTGMGCKAVDSAAVNDSVDRLVLGIAVGQELAKPSLETVAFVDPSRYIGLWYEIASIPQFFNTNCLCTTATYGIIDSTTISVFNQCRLNSVDGSLSTINGTAVVTDPGVNAKLQVAFFGPFGSDYYIIALASDYSYALVGDRLRRSLFVLSRTTTMDSATYNSLLSTAGGLGFDTSQLTLTRQSGCP